MVGEKECGLCSKVCSGGDCEYSKAVKRLRDIDLTEGDEILGMSLGIDDFIECIELMQDKELRAKNILLRLQHKFLGKLGWNERNLAENAVAIVQGFDTLGRVLEEDGTIFVYKTMRNLDTTGYTLLMASSDFDIWKKN